MAPIIPAPFYGNAASARQSAGQALARGRGRDVDYAAAFALALSGDLQRSRSLAEHLAREYPEDTSVQFMYLPALRALFSLDDGNPAAAIEAVQIASRHDLRSTASASWPGTAVCIPSTFAASRTSRFVNRHKPRASSSALSNIPTSRWSIP